MLCQSFQMLSLLPVRRLVSPEEVDQYLTRVEEAKRKLTVILAEKQKQANKETSHG